jgi:hypothetical protein
MCSKQNKQNVDNHFKFCFDWSTKFFSCFFWLRLYLFIQFPLRGMYKAPLKPFFVKINDTIDIFYLNFKYLDDSHGKSPPSHSTIMPQLDPVVMPISEGRYFDRNNEFVVLTLWNALPPQLKNLTDCNAVKSRRRKWY